MHPLIRNLLFALFATIVLCGLPDALSAQVTQQDTVEEKDEAPTIEATNLQDLRMRVGQTIIVTGDVDRIGKSSSGHRFLSFKGNGELTIFIASGDVGKFKEGTPEKMFEGKTIAVRGKVERFKNKPQIQVRAPESITLVKKERGPPAANLPKPVELAKSGRDTWKSPAGMVYSGRDPEGLTRKDHVLRHAKDLPNRDGPHGVFDGGEELTFAWIDAAWNQIEKNKLKPRMEAGREVYTVSMGRRVGFLGGKTGAERKNPPLTRVFIVVREGTQEVITAFPK